MEKRPSEIITEFLNFLEAAEREHESAYTAVGKEDSRVQLYGKVHEFYTDRQNQNLVKALRRLQNEQATVEKYLFGNREFKNRVD